MLTRREKILVRPWQQRQLYNHQRKVQCALPAIDDAPPSLRSHVTSKLKKLQREEDRVAQIEEDNFRLLQRMGVIMKTKRLDNEWKATIPNFLRRIGIYHNKLPTNEEYINEAASKDGISEVPKIRCLACYHQSVIKDKESLPVKIAEEEIRQKSCSSRSQPKARKRSTYPVVSIAIKH